MTRVSQNVLQPWTSTSQGHLAPNPQPPDRRMENEKLHLSQTVHLLLFSQDVRLISDQWEVHVIKKKGYMSIGQAMNLEIGLRKLNNC